MINLGLHDNIIMAIQILIYPVTFLVISDEKQNVGSLRLTTKLTTRLFTQIHMGRYYFLLLILNTECIEDDYLKIMINNCFLSKFSLYEIESNLAKAFDVAVLSRSFWYALYR